MRRDDSDSVGQTALERWARRILRQAQTMREEISAAWRSGMSTPDTKPRPSSPRATPVGDNRDSKRPEPSRSTSTSQPVATKPRLQSTQPITSGQRKSSTVILTPERLTRISINIPGYSPIEAYAVDDYHPKRGGTNPRHDESSWSKDLLSLKYSPPKTINYFAAELDTILGSGFPILTVPSSDPAKTWSGIRRVAKALAGDGRIDATSCLVRTTKIEKAATSEERYSNRRTRTNQHIQTIRVDNNHLIRGKHVLLLDDIGTTGASVRACHHLLSGAGAASVTCLVLGWTFWDD